MKTPVLVMILLMGFEWISVLRLHGTPKPIKNWNIFITTGDLAIYALIMWWGGFFS